MQKVTLCKIVESFLVAFVCLFLLFVNNGVVSINMNKNGKLACHFTIYFMILLTRICVSTKYM